MLATAMDMPLPLSAVVTFPVYVVSTVDSWSSIIARLLIVLIAVSVVVD